MVDASCPLCNGRDVRLFCSIESKPYWRCNTCLLTFLDAAARLTADAELKHYRTHQNEVDDPRYRSFLGRLATPLRACLAPASSGLDYGCGPGPALAAMLREAGHTMAEYDPFFAPDEAALAASYDFVTCTEVAEHFHDPSAEFSRLDNLLKPAGWLAIMTSFQTDDAAFANWHYRRDPTHVVFYKEETLRHLAHRKGWSFNSPAKDVALMQKPCDSHGAADSGDNECP